MREGFKTVQDCIHDYLRPYKFLDKSCLNIIDDNKEVIISLIGSNKYTRYMKSSSNNKYYRIN